MTSKEIRAREVIAHPERFEPESAEIKAYEMTIELKGEDRVETIVAILSGLVLTDKEIEVAVNKLSEQAVDIPEILVPKKKGRPVKKKK